MSRTGTLPQRQRRIMERMQKDLERVDELLADRGEIIDDVLAKLDAALEVETQPVTQEVNCGN